MSWPAVEYRVAPTVKFPAPLEDIKAALRFLRAHQDQYGIDPQRVGVVGGSAGGYLTALMATTSGSREFDKGDYLHEKSDITCAVDLYGLSDLTRIGADYSKQVQALHASSGATEACGSMEAVFLAARMAVFLPIKRPHSWLIPLHTFLRPRLL